MFASATNPSTGISSARAVGSMPAASSKAAGIDTERLQALPQHLAALAEGGLGHALQGCAIAGERLGRGVSRTTEDVTFGGGTKARRRDVEQDLRFGAPAGQHGEAAIRFARPGVATMRSATSRWNISSSRVVPGRPRLGGRAS